MSYIPPKPDSDGSPSRPPPPMAEAAPEGGASGLVEKAPAPAPAPEDLRFVNEMSAVGLLSELDGDELRRILGASDSVSESGRHLDMLDAYYDANGDDAASERRRYSDRFFLMVDTQRIGANGICQRLAALCPSLEACNLERIGSDDGPLVVRSGDHVVAVIDDYDESLDTDEIDLRALDDTPTVTVQAIVQAINTLLERHGDERRFVPIRGDVHREAYVALTIDGAIDLCRAGFLELDTKDEVREHCGFESG